MDKILSQTKSASTTAASSTGTAPADANSSPLTKGIVLDKDGKPCRTCTDTASWRALTRSLKSKTSVPDSKTGFAPATTATMTAVAAIADATKSSNTDLLSPSQQQSECPPDVQELGRSTWTLLHTLAATYPQQATTNQKAEMGTFLTLFAKLYPCWVCAEDFQAWIVKEKPVLEGRSGFGDWMCRAHNEVNRKLGKREFDCRFWEERWREGWKDGRCD